MPGGVKWGVYLCPLPKCVHVIIAYHVIAAPFCTVIIPFFVSDILILLQRKCKGDTSLRVIWSAQNKVMVDNRIIDFGVRSNLYTRGRVH